MINLFTCPTFTNSAGHMWQPPGCLCVRGMDFVEQLVCQIRLIPTSALLCVLLPDLLWWGGGGSVGGGRVGGEGGRVWEVGEWGGRGGVWEVGEWGGGGSYLHHIVRRAPEACPHPLWQAPPSPSSPPPPPPAGGPECGKDHTTWRTSRTSSTIPSSFCELLHVDLQCKSSLSMEVHDYGFVGLQYFRSKVFLVSYFKHLPRS